jgi:anion transporter
MSAFLSNTGTAAVMIPVCIGISLRTGINRQRLLMPMAFASVMGGGLSLIGTPVNLIAASVLEEAGYSFHFFEFAIIGLPVLVVGTIYFAFIGYKLLPSKPIDSSKEDFYDNVQDFTSVPRWKQYVAFIVLGLTVLGMIFENQIGIALHVTSSTGALILVITGVLNQKQALKAVDMPTIFLFAGTLALATALDVTGAGAQMATLVLDTLGPNASPFALMAAIILIAAAMTSFMSNTATTALLAPIGLSIAIAMEADPRAVLMATAVGGAMSYMTPVATPPLTMVVGLGGYKFNDFVKNGLPLMVIIFVISVILLPMFFPFFPV